MKISFFYFPVILILFCHPQNKNPKVILETVIAFDERLQFPADEDIREILTEGQRIITLKLGNDIELEFNIQGKMSLDELFQKINLQELSYYPKRAKYKYDLNLGENAPVFADKNYRKTVIEFLKNWELKSLQKFFYGKKITSYNDVFDELLKVYHKKIAWLRSLKTPRSELLVFNPSKSFQSYIDWETFMYAQSEYDVILTNTLIIMDSINTPYPHSITKHSKVGGSSFESPKRNPMIGHSLLINFLEEYGNIEGIGNNKDIPKNKKNKMVGALLFAHEFGHAFFHIPDVYDHPDSCLMNASMDNGDMEKNYDILIADKLKCPKCRPWIESKKQVLDAQNYFSKNKFNLAGNLFLDSANKLPVQFDGNREQYLSHLYKSAKISFAKINDQEKITEIEKLEREIK